MTVFVDDSGWGSLIGGVAIGMYNDKEDIFMCRLIPVKYFQGKAFKQQEYLDLALDAFVEMESQIGDYSKIVVCRGFILDRIWDHLEEFGRVRIIRAEIGDPLQGLLEHEFAKYLETLGVDLKSDGAHGLSYDDQVKWATKYKNRSKHVKNWMEVMEKTIESKILKGSKVRLIDYNLYMDYGMHYNQVGTVVGFYNEQTLNVRVVWLDGNESAVAENNIILSNGDWDL